MFDPDIHIRHGTFLPHWTKDGGIYHVCIRLADSIPREKLEAWKEERKNLAQKAATQTLTKGEQQRLAHLFSEKIEKYLDAGHGACWLKQDKIAEVVAETLWHFNEKSYQLFAWCIMPNHVHVILQQLNEELPDIAYSWKWFTAKRANIILQRKGSFWQREYFDHLLRNQEQLERAIEYVWNNPETAGLKNWKWQWCMDQR